MLGQRLKQLRLARGFSLEALAAEMGGIVTKQALSKYERGIANPSAVVFNKLAPALGVKAVYLWSEPEIKIRFIAYRKGSKLAKKEQAKVEGIVSEALEKRVHLQKITGQENGAVLPVRPITINAIDEAENAANTIRDQWNLGTDSIASMTGVLEDHYIHVLQIDANEKFDGISAAAYDDEEKIVAAAVVTREGVPGERQRLNLSHELGHLVLEVSEAIDEEKTAFRFGSAFLAPADTVRKEVGKRRGYIQPEELLLLKQRFGMSVQALLYRLHDLDIINDSYYKQWCKNINWLSWRRQEPFEMPSESPQWLRQNVLHAYAEGLISNEEADDLLGEALEGKESLSLIERRAFMKLPLEERRRLLAEHADKMASYYTQHSKAQEFQAGDFVEY